jgi:hypothetical protein
MAEGQELGVRDKYTYVMDDGTTIKLTLDKTLGDAPGNGLTATTTADGAINKPLSFKPRVVFVQRTTATGRLIRKQIVCNSTSTLYTSKIETNVTIGGDAYQTTGRRGEVLSF